MPKTTKIKATINGIEIVCNKEDFGEILSTMTGNKPVASSSSPAIVLRKGSDLAKAFDKIEADDAGDFVMKAIAIAGTQGVHTVYSGLNTLLRKKFNVDPVKVTTELIEAGLITGRGAKGGFSIKKA